MDTKVKPMLFYHQISDMENCRYKIFLENILETIIETYPVKEHREMYDHNDIPKYFPDTDTKMPDTCWCDIPDENNPWPQLYIKTSKGYDFIAAGDSILDLDIENIHKKYGKNFIRNGQFI
jgi:hypothetical protein